MPESLPPPGTYARELHDLLTNILANPPSPAERQAMAQAINAKGLLAGFEEDAA